MTAPGVATRVLAVRDDTRLDDPLLTLLDAAPEFELVGPVPPGRLVVDMVRRHRPGVIVLAADRLGTAELETVRLVMAEEPTPIVLERTSAEAGGAMADDALRAGALELLTVDTAALSTPGGRRRILETLALLARTPVVRRADRSLVVPARNPAPDGTRTKIETVAFVASTGGPAALAEVFSAFPHDFAASVLVVQHLADGFVSSLVEWLAEVARLPAKLAENGDRMQPAHVYVAPDGRHLVVDRGGRLRLEDAPAVDGHRPSANVLLESLAKAKGAAALGVVLTGMGDDGARGLSELRRAGGRTLAQDEATSQVFGMPRAARDRGAAEQLVPLSAIGPLVVRWVGRSEEAKR